MARADWTYEMPPFVADGRGIEAFSVETAGRTPGGTVATVLEHESEVYVAVDRSGILGREDLRAVPGSRSRRSTWTRLSSGWA